jgi:hypothetical protein
VHLARPHTRSGCPLMMMRKCHQPATMHAPHYKHAPTEMPGPQLSSTSKHPCMHVHSIQVSRLPPTPCFAKQCTCARNQHFCRETSAHPARPQTNGQTYYPGDVGEGVRQKARVEQVLYVLLSSAPTPLGDGSICFTQTHPSTTLESNAQGTQAHTSTPLASNAQGVRLEQRVPGVEPPPALSCRESCENLFFLQHFL